MTKKMKTPHFAFYPKDFYTDTLDLSDELVGVYIRLLCREWFNGPLKTVPGELLDYFTKTRAGYINDRLEKEREKSLRLWNQRREASEIAAQRRKTPSGPPSGQPSDPPNQNQNQNQSKKKNQIQKKEERGEVILPWNTENFTQFWETWKKYKRQEHGFKYKTAESEQAALMKLRNLAGGEEEIAMMIIFNSMANSWKGFFGLKLDELKQLKTQAHDDGLDQIRRKYNL